MSNLTNHRASAVPRPSLKSRILSTIHKDWMLYLMFLPGLVYILLFKYAPMYGVTIAFKDFKIGMDIMDAFCGPVWPHSLSPSAAKQHHYQLCQASVWFSVSHHPFVDDQRGALI